MKKFLILSLILSSTIFARNINYASKIVFVPVKKSVPIYIKVERKIPIQECYEQPEQIQHKDTNSIGVDTLIGGVLGVAVGNQIGKGSGRDAAKVIGGISGALIANNLRNKNNRRIEKNCHTTYDISYDMKLKGYNNYFIINGVKYHKFSKRPLNEVKININYSW